MVLADLARVAAPKADLAVIVVRKGAIDQKAHLAVIDVRKVAIDPKAVLAMNVVRKVAIDQKAHLAAGLARVDLVLDRRAALVVSDAARKADPADSDLAILAR